MTTFDASRDLDHQPRPDWLRVRNTHDGGVTMNRCATCRGFIWRPSWEFEKWSHSTPSRTARLNTLGVER